MTQRRAAQKILPVITIREVAHLAGVSVATVSKVLNDYPYVRGETQRRVREAIAQLGFQPNASARQLQGGTARMIALDLRQQPQHQPLDGRNEQLGESTFLFRLLAGIGQVTAAADYNVLWSTPTNLSPEEHAQAIARLYQTGRVDGIIVGDIGIADPRMALLRACGCPFVVIGNPGDDSVSVDSDNVGAGRMVAATFWERGHRRFAFLGAGPVQHAQDRLSGYRMTIAERGGEFIALPTATAATSFERGREQVRALHALPAPPTAIFCASHLIGLGALTEAKTLGLRVPEELAVVAFDDEPTSEISTPPLASVAQDIAGLGQEATRRLFTQFAGGPIAPRRLLLPTRLIPHRSLGDFSGEQRR